MLDKTVDLNMIYGSQNPNIFIPFLGHSQHQPIWKLFREKIRGKIGEKYWDFFFRLRGTFRRLRGGADPPVCMYAGNATLLMSRL